MNRATLSSHVKTHPLSIFLRVTITLYLQIPRVTLAPLIYPKLLISEPSGSVFSEKGEFALETLYLLFFVFFGVNPW